MEEGIPVCSFLKVLDLEQVFKQWAYPSLLKCCGKCTSVKRGVDNVSKRRYDRRRFNKKLILWFIFNTILFDFAKLCI